MKFNNILKFSFVAVLGLLFAMFTGIETASASSVMMATIVSTNPLRVAYNSAVNYLRDNGMIDQGAVPILTATNLRLEQKLDPNQSVIKFEPRRGTSSGDRALENKLGDNDIFFGIAIALNLQKVDANGLDAANNPLYTFPDVVNFPSAGEAAALETVFQGMLNIISGPLHRQQNMSTDMMRYVPEVQGEAGVGGTIPQYGPSLGERGYFEHQPMIILKGKETNKIELSLGHGVRTAIAGGAGKENIVVFKWFGFMWTGATGEASCGI